MALGALLGASGAEKKKLGAALGRLGAKKESKMGAKMAPLNAPRCLHEANMLQEGSKKPLGTDFSPPLGALRKSKTAFCISSFHASREPRGPARSTLQDIQEHSKVF